MLSDTKQWLRVASGRSGKVANMLPSVVVVTFLVMRPFASLPPAITKPWRRSLAPAEKVTP